VLPATLTSTVAWLLTVSSLVPMLMGLVVTLMVPGAQLP
jgi:hypothetical protein